MKSRTARLLVTSVGFILGMVGAFMDNALFQLGFGLMMGAQIPDVLTKEN